jgi:hypothetical protein
MHSRGTESIKAKKGVNSFANAAARSMVPAAALLLLAATFAMAAPLHRLSADFQNTASGANEVVTTAPPSATPVNPSTTVAPAGNLVYTKSVSIPFDVAYVTFSAQGDAHNGAALLMQATITDSNGITTICQPLAGQTGTGGGGPNVFPQWYTLLNLPAGASGPNCSFPVGDGGGGPSDCHDNAISFTCCALLTHDGGGTTHSVNIGLASSVAGAPVFYERSTIYVDGSPNPGGQLCTPHGVP